MNLDYHLQRLLGRATCRLGPRAKLMRTARIRNIRGDDDCIAVGANSIIRGELLTFAHGGRIELGAWCYVGEGSRIWSAASVRIGDRVLIAHGVNIFDNLTHPIDPAARHEQIRKIFTRGHPRELDLDERPVAIGDDAWIGAGAFVMRGVQVGARAIVAAGAVVTKDVAEGTVVAGNPASVIRSILDT
ncbi:acyltransferase [Bradyrhizobium stylosanthis]|uniref:Acetyltransferase-like isoleucine patch superfamily enzyme n=1 Tax=Bradyrhizobium stylosanthis TaxID=1803665 RepID=A0A560DY71_9BRAD|nr:acyltransferase [Bradyrhizobium stylosanthis]TWB02023.1 acetyltransferase-like isoleucine patch superfamily enzyme [Bradyrhizobium stylosanthis]